MVIEYLNKKVLYDRDSSYKFILSMNNVFAYADTTGQEELVEDTGERDQKSAPDKTEDNNQDLDKLSLTELLKLLDAINERIESGELTEEDLKMADTVLEEIKKR
jgi:anti-sigma28 factor (negative regulator of flagellin synthesis)